MKIATDSANLILEYEKVKEDIGRKLIEFDRKRSASDKDIFSELAYCIFTAGGIAIKCDKAVKQLKNSGLLFEGTAGSISKEIKGLVRFHNNKADYLVTARDFFNNADGWLVKDKLNSNDIFKTRERLVKNIKGVGYKVASHFLRNIGLGSDIAILDRHILKNLKEYRVIDEIPKPPINKAAYLAIEDKMREFSEKIGIPLEELDLLFWSLQTGFIFK